MTRIRQRPDGKFYVERRYFWFFWISDYRDDIHNIPRSFDSPEMARKQMEKDGIQ